MAQNKEKQDNLLPPDEKFWKRYSPHHEAFLSGTGSLTLHGLVLGLMFLLGMAAQWARSNENTRPPNMDLIQLVGGGDGGGEPAPFGQPDGTNQKEAVSQDPVQKSESSNPEVQLNIPPQSHELTLPEDLPDETSKAAKDDVGAFLTEIGKEAKKSEKTQVKKIATTAKVNAPQGRSDGQPGKKGLGGSGGGTGTGIGKGSGSGMGGPGGPMTQQQIYARRWRFDMSGSGKDHAEKLAAAGVILAIRDQVGHFKIVYDLKRRPVVGVSQSLYKFKDAVFWINLVPESLTELAKELKLRSIPSAVIMLLPKDREQKMAQAEAQFAAQHGRDFKRIQETWFDFRFRNGNFEPIVISQK